VGGRPWYQTFFGADYLKTHRSFLTETTAAEVEFVQAALALRPGHAVLDVPCGHGRHALELARLGHRVTGVDLSQDFIQLARKQAFAQEVGDRTEFLHGDMRELGFDSEFDAVINVFNSFGYFGNEEDLEVLEGMARALKPGGRLLLDNGNRDYYLLYAAPTSWEELFDCYVLYRFAFHAQTGVAHTQQIVLDKGGLEPRTYDIAVRAYTFPELNRMLETVGLSVYAVYGDWDGSQFTTESPRMIVTAIKDERG